MNNLSTKDLKSKASTWRVWTDGDCEGKSIKEIAIVQGKALEIIKAFGDQAFYNLNLELSNKTVTINELPKKKIYKDIHFHIWGLDNQDLALVELKKLYPKANLSKSNFWKSLKLQA
jgi:hypothetical protein